MNLISIIDQKPFAIRAPEVCDGKAVFRLIQACPPLDLNSAYCYWLLCDHFAATSAVAVIDGQISGFISSYVKPQQVDTLFVWQVAVAAHVRGAGLASAMLRDILQRPACRQISNLEASAAADNLASHALFKRLANKFTTSCKTSAWLDQHAHFDGAHPSELLIRVGPFVLPE